jgi:UDP-N-acetylmuramate--alanine ligase
VVAPPCGGFMYNTRLHFHFTGVGGVGMSGLAEILLNLGYQVSGSDLKESLSVKRLRDLGAAVAIGHAAEHLSPAASLVVFSSAVSGENPEILEARRRGLPVIRRAEVLAELIRLKYGVVVAGSHGKTTTTAMVGRILEVGGKDPTIIVGGTLSSSGGGGILGRGEFLVAEADESDRSFLLLSPAIAVVTNIDDEHLGAYGSLADLEQSFSQFLHSVPFYGLAVVCADDPRVMRVAASLERRIVTYGFSPAAQLSAIDISFRPGESTFTVTQDGESIATMTLPMPGRHMVLNALAACAVGIELGIPVAQIGEALGTMPRIGRRMEVLARAHGITVMSDYGHHPTEIRATLKAVRESWMQEHQRLRVIFEPHRYSRTSDCFGQFLDCFAAADEVMVSEIYAAGESPMADISGERLFQAMRHAGKRWLPKIADSLPTLREEMMPGDLVLFMGAGSIGGIGEQFARSLQGAALAPEGIG